DRELAVVQRVEVRRCVELLSPRDLRGLRFVGDDARIGVVAMVVPAAGTLDVYHLRAVVREEARRPGADGFPGEVEDADTAQDARTHRGSCVHRMAPAVVSAAISSALKPR